MNLGFKIPQFQSKWLPLKSFYRKGDSAALGWRMPRKESSFFKKYEKKNLEFFTWIWENDVGNLCLSLIDESVFSAFKKNRPDFQEKKVNFLFKVFLY